MTDSRIFAVAMILLTFVGGWCCYVFLAIGSGLALFLSLASVALAFAMRVGDIDQCQLVGHRYDPEGERHGYYDCERCEYVGYEPAETACSLARSWWSYRRWRFTRWIRYAVIYRWQRIRCPDCRCWFGRHDYAIDDHIPF